MSGWIIFTICFTTLLVGTWSAVTILVFYRANRQVREAEIKGPARRERARLRAGRGAFESVGQRRDGRGRVAGHRARAGRDVRGGVRALTSAEAKRGGERVEWESMAAEQLILVDADDRELGVGEKMQVHRAGALHRAFSVFIFDGRGRLLLQKRAPVKYHSAGLWSNTACGHPRPGEATRAAARRRLREEMGFDCELREAFEFVYRAELDGALVEHEYDHVFVGTHDGDPAPDPSEVEEWRWVSMGELRRGLREEPQLYSRWLKLAVEGDHRRLLGVREG